MNHGFKITAHRGIPSLYPENSMIGFIKAYEFGAHELEMDVRITKDNQLVLMHDRSTQRTTGYDKNVDETLYSELENLNLNFHHACSMEKIPKIEDIFIYFQDKNINFLLDCKREVTLQKSKIPSLLVPLVSKYNLQNRVRYASSWESMLKDFKILTQFQAKTVINAPVQNLLHTKFLTKLAYKKHMKSKFIDDYSVPFGFEFDDISKDIIKLKNGNVNIYSAFDCTNSSNENTFDENKIIENCQKSNYILTDNIVALKIVLEKYLFNNKQN